MHESSSPSVIFLPRNGSPSFVCVCLFVCRFVLRAMVVELGIADASLGLWIALRSLSPLFPCKTAYSTADMLTHRGVIYDSCRLGLLSCAGHCPPLSAQHFNIPLGVHPIGFNVCPLWRPCGITAQKCGPRACVVQSHQLLPWREILALTEVQFLWSWWMITF